MPFDPAGMLNNAHSLSICALSMGSPMLSVRLCFAHLLPICAMSAGNGIEHAHTIAHAPACIPMQGLLVTCQLCDAA